MSLPAKWVACDPGESFGFTVMRGHEIVSGGTVALWEFIHALAAALGLENPREHDDPELVKSLRGVELVVYEDWKLYPWLLQELAWDQCRTARGIGAIEFICQSSGIPYEAQGADTKDQAESAGAADLFLRPLDENRHQNDSIRHAVVKAVRSGEAVAWRS